jgi:hypothetical protein
MEIYIKTSGQPQENTICQCKINGITLPLDVQISLNGDKLISSSQIIDGVTVYERVTRKPYTIDFDFVLREKTTSSGSNTIFNISYNTAGTDQWIFPLDKVAEMFQNIWSKDQVVAVENVYLNKLGIINIIINDIQIGTVRGSTDVPVRLKASEDFYSVKQQGQSLLI